MTAYTLVELKIHDLDKVSAMRGRFPATIGAHGGNFPARRDEIEIDEKRRGTISAQGCTSVRDDLLPLSDHPHNDCLSPSGG
jgi:hypothetical protein